MIQIQLLKVLVAQILRYFLSRTIRIFTILALFLSVMPLTFAWNATGHKLVAQIAYMQLNNDAKQQVDELLNHQFVQDSVWADVVRAKGDESMSTWHYINLPEPSPQKNVVDAIIDSEAILKNPTVTRTQKQRALKGLIHWVADVHQPLHTLGRDRGGNLFFLKQNPYGKNLHQLWDSGAGALKNIKDLKQTAQLWQQEYPATTAQMMHTQPLQWAQESYVIASTRAYVGVKPKTVPDAAYIKMVQGYTKKQIVLAGDRLADILNRVYD